MITAILTDAGAKRLGVPHLAGKTVQVDVLLDNLLAGNVYYRGEKIGCTVSYVGDDATLKLLGGSIVINSEGRQT